MEKFYIIWNKRIWSSNVYHTLEDAEKARKKLQKENNQDIEFHIMEYVSEDYILRKL